MSEEIERESTAGEDKKGIGVDGIEAETGNFVRDARFDWQPVELTENWCHVGRRRCTD